MKVGVMGLGVVGTAHYTGLQKINVNKDLGLNIVAYDIDEQKSCSTEKHLKEIRESHICFICVPTPTINGSQKIDSVVNALNSLEYYNGLVVLKSTILPTVLDRLAFKQFPHLNIVHNPEFLTARTAELDFLRQEVILLGGERLNTLKVKEFYEGLFPKAKIYVSEDFNTTAMAKYMANVFFATKIAVWNEFYKVCERYGFNYNLSKQFAYEATGWFTLDHTEVPGPDGTLGFGGECFPKDITAFQSFCDRLQLLTIKGAIDSNKIVRGIKHGRLQ